jgi:hypothetical protein
VFFGIQDDGKCPEKSCEFCTEFMGNYTELTEELSVYETCLEDSDSENEVMVFLRVARVYLFGTKYLIEQKIDLVQ